MATAEKNTFLHVNLNLEERDLAIKKMQENIKTLDKELDTAYKRVQKENTNSELLNEYDFLMTAEKQIIKTHIKKLKELYNYINQQHSKKTEKSTKEDKNEIMKEINKLEKILRK